MENLGESAVFYPRTAFPDSGDLREYYRRLASDFRAPPLGSPAAVGDSYGDI